MTDLNHLFENNARWAEKIQKEQPGFFEALAKQQAPEYLWIGCSDSRVPANEIVDLMPGELFVHRNVANIVIHTDLNCMSVMQFAVEFLKVKHIMVTGHYGCGGVKAALEGRQLGLVDYWVRAIRDVYYTHKELIDGIGDPTEQLNQLCELNVKQQVANVSHTNIIQNAWKRGQELTIHGWIYGIHDGRVRNLMEPISSVDQVPEQYRVY
ncbi:carbonate dehydratase [Cellvibrio sp. PSBB006]|jgi:carbonic anhydrase|uniref:carbonate dehydratase n=1 Tax=Cellvibrio sp. PSBB006 TaxID=1987723 RepID=UPI000B3B5AF9|nr:carbonate dehydratase [Cellvibrio sp. PSBB006]ARU27398.1 carbonate dehydratase [Cellvibrio sp. PSBB006]